MTFTNLGKEDWKELNLDPKTYDDLQKFCEKHKFGTWSSAIRALLKNAEFGNLDKFQVIEQRLGPRPGPETQARRHGNLHVGAAGHRDELVGLGERRQRPHQGDETLGHQVQPLLAPEAEVDEDLVVAAAAGVEFLAEGAEFFGQALLTAVWTSSCSGLMANRPAAKSLRIAFRPFRSRLRSVAFRMPTLASIVAWAAEPRQSARTRARSRR